MLSKPASAAATVLLLLVADAAALGLDASEDAPADAVVVVAVVDTGINPYHVDFADPTRAAHPSTTIPGYPSGATALGLTLDAPDYETALRSDSATLDAIEEGVLYHVPGTKIVGYYRGRDASAVNGEPDRRPLIDDDGHGTAAASLAAGNVHGACPRCVLVVVEGFDGLAWATAQPWIDVVSASFGAIANAGVPARGFGLANDHTLRGAERGQTVLFSSGNGVENAFITPEATYFSNTNGPDWVVSVGAWAPTANGSERRPILGTGKPVDVIGPGVNVPAADRASLDGETGFSGTSAATPVAAGGFADALRLVRGAIGDDGAGQRRAGGRWIVADGDATGSGALADGVLTRQELWDAVFATAEPARGRGIGIYPASTHYMRGSLADAAQQGYGAVDAATAARAADVLLGIAEAPPRDDVASFMSLDSFVRDSLWGPWDRDGDGMRERSLTPEGWLP